MEIQLALLRNTGNTEYTGNSGEFFRPLTLSELSFTRHGITASPSSPLKNSNIAKRTTDRMVEYFAETI